MKNPTDIRSTLHQRLKQVERQTYVARYQRQQHHSSHLIKIWQQI